MTDLIKSPPHYTRYKFQPLDVIEDWNLCHHLACVVKYIARHPHKGGLEDLEKALEYLERKIKLEKANERQ